MDPNRNPDENTEDLMIAPEDSLMTTEDATATGVPDEEEKISYTPPKAWGGDQTLSPVGTPQANLPPTPETPPTSPFPPIAESPSTSWTAPGEMPPPAPLLPPVETLPPMPVIEHGPSSFMKTLLTGLALVLIGVLVGVVASQLVPASPPTPLPAVPTVEPSVSVLPSEEPPVLTPTATPSALLNLKWNMMTVKSPLTLFNSYRIYYPTTWSIKEYKNTPGTGDSGSSTLTLVKGTTTLNILQQNVETAGCVYNGTAEGPGLPFGDYRELVHDSIVWRSGLITNGDLPAYQVCESKEGSFSTMTSIGFIYLSGSSTDAQTLEEYNYILEKLVIL